MRGRGVFYLDFILNRLSLSFKKGVSINKYISQEANKVKNREISTAARHENKRRYVAQDFA